MIVLERIKTFLWLTNHDHLLTNMIIAKWNHRSKYCKFCLDMKESIIHVLRDCTFAWKIGERLVDPNYIVEFSIINLQEWFDLNLNHNIGVTKKYKWHVIWAVSC